MFPDSPAELTGGEDFARFRQMRDTGATPHEVYGAAADAVLPPLSIVRLLRELYGLSFEAFRQIRFEVEGLGGYPLRTAEEVSAYLKEGLSFCGCMPDARRLLRDTLRKLDERADLPKDPAAFRRWREDFERLAGLETVPTLAAAYLFLLESHGLLQHGFHIGDCMLTPAGVSLLRVIEKHPACLLPRNEPLEETAPSPETADTES